MLSKHHSSWMNHFLKKVMFTSSKRQGAKVTEQLSIFGTENP
jgi:hypothetical protein